MQIRKRAGDAVKCQRFHILHHRAFIDPVSRIRTVLAGVKQYRQTDFFRLFINRHIQIVVVSVIRIDEFEAFNAFFSKIMKFCRIRSFIP